MRLTSDSTRGDHLLTVLADWDGERATVDNRLAASQTVNARDNFGVSAQQQMLWPRVFVTIGARVERNDSFGTAFVPRATVVYVAHQPSADIGETRLKASAGTGIKEPTMLESFSASPFFRGNPHLEPERSRSVELGRRECSASSLGVSECHQCRRQPASTRYQCGAISTAENGTFPRGSSSGATPDEYTQPV